MDGLSRVAVTVLLALGAALSARADNHTLAEAESGGRPVAPASQKTRLSGCAGKNNSGEFVNFGLTLGNDFSQYQMNGSSNPDQGLYQTDADYSGVALRKVTNENGLTRIQPIDNSGTVQVYPRKRKMNDVVLAGVPVSGYSVAKMFTGSLDMNQLEVGGAAAKGKLFYNVFTGSYSCPAGSCAFGPYAIRSSQSGSKVVLNYDNFINSNRMRVSMKFGDLVLDGNIKFTDTTKTTQIDEDSSVTSVTSTQGCFNVSVTKADGSKLNLAAYGEKETEDDKAARHLLAWLQLMTYDLFSE
jgi:hypothetical protein